MITLLAVAPDLPDALTLVPDLEVNGLRVCARCTRLQMVRQAVHHAPDLIVVWEPHPDEPLFEAIRLLGASVPVPVLVFTGDARAETMEAALQAGIEGWVVNGYAAARLRPLVQLTLARHRQSQQARAERLALEQRLDERRLVERAKGILMTARQLSEDEAFRLLRSASMHAKLRIGQLSQQVVDAAHAAETVNRAGRLRMLSQRIVKLHALAALGVEVAGSRALLAVSGEQIGQSLALLERNLSRPTYGDLLDAVQDSWATLQASLTGTSERVDEAAERLLTQADQLTAALEHAGVAPTLHIINLSGRQRMLAQRMAKQALLRQGDVLAPHEPLPEDMAATVAAFEQAMAYLKGMPLSSTPIRDGLAAAERTWREMIAAARKGDFPAARVTLAATSESLLELFDRLTGDYEQSMQILMG